MKKRIITNDEYRGLVQNICRQIEISDWRPDYIVGITRGGLVPAVMISQYFDIPMWTLRVNLRDHAETESNTWMAEDAFGYIPEDWREGIDKRDDPTFSKKILVVDDINDTGATINWITDDWQSSCLPEEERWNHVWNYNVRFAVVIDNLASKCNIKMDYCGEEINKEEDPVWIDFPYEGWWK
jgi:xanthine phosphoribosyltransferase